MARNPAPVSRVFEPAPPPPPTITELLLRYEEATRALQTLDAAGVITSVSVSTPLGQLPVIGAIIDTQDMTYPPQMIEVIKAAVAERRAKIVEQLAALGVTGLGGQPNR